jgi:large subunit ribosomal protein L13e
LGVTVDHRRRNRSEESFTVNVARLKKYKGKLVVFPRRTNKRAAGGKNTDVFQGADSKLADVKAVYTQNKAKTVFPVVAPVVKSKARKITEEEKKVRVTAVLRKAMTDAKLWGVREVRQKKKAEEAAAKAKKAAKDAEM